MVQSEAFERPNPLLTCVDAWMGAVLVSGLFVVYWS